MLNVYSDELHKHNKELYKANKTKTSYILMPTYENLAESLNITKDVLINWVKGKGGYGENGLEEKGFVKPIKIDPKKRTSKMLLYLNPGAKEIQTTLAGVKYNPTNRNEEMQPILFDEYTQREALKLFLKIENKENCKKTYQYITKFIEQNRLKISEYKYLAEHLQKFKNGCGDFLLEYKP